MKVGDLVIRKINAHTNRVSHALRESEKQKERLGHGIVLSKQMAGSNPVHPCITVLYPKTGEVYDIAESLVEIVSEV